MSKHYIRVKEIAKIPHLDKWIIAEAKKLPRDKLLALFEHAVQYSMDDYDDVAALAHAMLFNGHKLPDAA